VKTVAKMRSIFLGLLLLVLCTPGAGAFQFTPFSDSIKVSKESEKQFTVVNSSDAPIAVQVTLHKRAMDGQGEDVLTDGEDDFLLFPPQMIVPPGGTRKIRVQWLGAKDIESEQAYRIIAEQVPVNLERLDQGNGAQIQVMLRYVASLYVRPDNAKSNIVLRSLSKDKDAKGNATLKLTVENTGTRHSLLEDIKLSVGGAVLVTADLPGIADNNVLAKTSRTFVIPLPAKLKNISTLSNAELKYRESF